MKSKTEMIVGAVIYEVFESVFLFMAGMMFGISLVPMLSRTHKMIGYLGTGMLLIMSLLMNHKKQYNKDKLVK